jgi:hypothetical protein
LCEAGRTDVSPESTVSIARLVERSAADCAAEPAFLRCGLPVLERVFRLVLVCGGGPISADYIIDTLDSGITLEVLRRLGPTASARYPLSWHL